MNQQITQKAAAQAKAAAKAGQKTVEQAVKANKENVDKAVKVSKETAEKAYQAGAEAVTKSYDTAFSAAKDQVKQSFPQAADKFDEFASYQKANLDAFFAAGAIAAKGFEALSDQFIAFNQKTVEDTVANAKAILDCTTVQEFVEVQSGYARESFDRFVSEGTKLSETSVKVANEAAEPLQARATKTVETFAKPIAA